MTLVESLGCIRDVLISPIMDQKIQKYHVVSRLQFLVLESISDTQHIYTYYFPLSGSFFPAVRPIRSFNAAI